MKYCVVGPTYPFRGGIAHYTTMLVHHLRQQHEVRFYSYWRQYPSWLFPGNTEADPSGYTFEEPCERTLDPLNPFSWWRTARQIVADRPDILLLQWWTPFWLPLLLLLSLAARRAKIPILYFCHQFVEPDSSPIEWLTAQPALRLGDGLIVVTRKELAMAERAFPGKPIRLGFHPIYDNFPSQHLAQAEARQRLGLDPNGPLLLFFGFVRRYKGLHYLLQALAQLSQPVRLLVAGEFWEEAQAYQRLIGELGLTERVILHNRYIPNEEIEPYFAAADSLVLPYLSGSQSGVGMLAWHYGVPVITTCVGGLAETVRHEETGLVVPPADSAALAAAIERFFREEMGGPFRLAMEQSRARFSWAALIRIIEEISHEISGVPSLRVSHPADDPSFGPRSGLQ